MEPVLGAGGVIVPHETFMPLMREICDRHGILLIADEVITRLRPHRRLDRFARLGCQAGPDVHGQGHHQRLLSLRRRDDLRTRSRQAFEADKTAIGSIGHGYTYSGHPVGAAAALATLKETKRLNVAANAGVARCRAARAWPEALKDKHELIGDVRGKA